MTLKTVPKINNMRLVTRQEWGSQATDHRFAIRKSIATSYPLRNPSACEELKERPILNKGFVSIAHCPGMGGYAYADSPIGIDIEKENRIQKRVVARMASDDEMKNTPSFAALWSAKEAAYKAIPPEKQPPAISNIQIQWHEKVQGWQKFSIANHKDYSLPNGQGYFQSVAPFQVALFIFADLTTNQERN